MMGRYWTLLVVASIALVGMALNPGGAQAAQADSSDGTLSVVVEASPPHLDPMQTASQLTRRITDSINVFLVQNDTNLDIHPSLATTWQLVDPTTYRFKLRQDVKFHNGRTLVADDVRRLTERMLDPKTASPLRSVFEMIDQVRVVDTHEVEFKLKYPYAPFLEALLLLPIIPMEVVQAQGHMRTNPVGAGPYRFVEWRQGQEITLERFDQWFEDVKNKRLVFRHFPEYATGVAAFETGAANVHMWLNPNDVERFRQRNDIRLIPNQLNAFRHIGMNIRRQPWSDVRARQAVLHAVNIDEIIRLAFQNLAVPVTVPIRSGGPWYDQSLDMKRDPQRARELASQAKLTGTYTLISTNNPTEAPLARVVQNQLQAVGINTRLELLEVPAYLSRVFQRHDFDLTVVGHASSGDPHLLLSQYYHSKGSSNFVGYVDPELDTLIDQGARTLDPKARKEIYIKAHRLFLERVPAVYLVSEIRYGGMRSNVSGVIFKPNHGYVFSTAIVK